MLTTAVHGITSQRGAGDILSPIRNDGQLLRPISPLDGLSYKLRLPMPFPDSLVEVTPNTNPEPRSL